MKTINFVLMAAALFASNSMVSVYAARQQLNSATKSFSVKLGATRVIYHAGTPSATLSVSNPQNYLFWFSLQSKQKTKIRQPLYGDAASISFRSEPAESTAYYPYWW